MLPPVCCLLLLPAVAEESRWMQQLFETALHFWWQWPRKTCRAREGPVRALGFHTPYTHSYFLSGIEWNFHLLYGWSAADDLFCLWGGDVSTNVCSGTWNDLLLSLWAQGAKEGHEATGICSVPLFAWEAQVKNLSKYQLHGVDIWDIPFLNTNQILKIPACSFWCRKYVKSNSVRD